MLGNGFGKRFCEQQVCPLPRQCLAAMDRRQFPFGHGVGRTSSWNRPSATGGRGAFFCADRAFAGTPGKDSPAARNRPPK
jgi:hypothetical protein